MTTFKEIRGQLIKSLSSDPSPATAGDMWYNSTSQTLKGVVVSAAWSAGGALSVPRSVAGLNAGTQTAGIAFGGYNGTSFGNTNSTEEYNGSSWTGGGNLSTARRAGAGFGIQTSAVLGGGYGPSNATEEYDGSSWTGGGNMPASFHNTSGCGTLTTGLSNGASESPTQTCKYDGTSWTAASSLPSGRTQGGTAGTSAAAIAAGGFGTNSYEWGGSSWTAAPDLNSPRSGGNSMFGISTSAIIGGNPSPNATEEWNGTNWSTTGATMGTPRNSYGMGGTTTAGLAFGGSPYTTSTEEYSPAAATKTFTTS